MRALERRLPSRRSLLVAVALAAAGAALYTGARVTPVFAIRSIEVAGAPPPVAAHVRRALAPLRGESLLTLRGEDVERRVTALPEVAGATYDRAFPHTLRLVVRPEEPVAVLRRGAASWLVSARARVIAPLAQGAWPALARIWVGRGAGVAAGDTLGPDAGGRAARALAVLRAAAFPDRVRSVRANAGELTFVLANGLELRAGDETALRLKLAIARLALAEVQARRAGTIAYLDVSVPERPVSGLNPQPVGRG
jgi:cell division protein FtsQ